MANIRIRKTIEPPRPLKSTLKTTINTTQDVPVTDEYLISFAETLSNALLTNSADVSVQNDLITLSQQLKLRGPILEVNYGDALDKIFVIFRNALQSEGLNYNVRVPLLQLIELRATGWKASEGANSYYRPKVSKIQEAAAMEPLLPSTSPELYSSATGPLLLEQGEVVRTSGKYSRPTKIQGKNYSKDEVVIRNADSGKVNPGAKERLVQITGVSEDKINCAKKLIEDTIRRNASPVRSLVNLLGGGDCEPGQDIMDIAVNTEDEAVIQNSKNRSASDSAVEEYNYSVSIGNEILKISGMNLNYVTAAKLVLDRFFSSQYFQSSNQNSDEGEFLNSTPSEEMSINFGNGISTVAEETPSKPMERRKYFHRKSSEFKDTPEGNVVEIHRYSREFLLDATKYPQSQHLEKDRQIIFENAKLLREEKDSGMFDVNAYLSQERDCPQTSVISASDVKADSPDPE